MIAELKATLETIGFVVFLLALGISAIAIIGAFIIGLFWALVLVVAGPNAHLIGGCS
jgi:hypothetical protein